MNTDMGSFDEIKPEGPDLRNKFQRIEMGEVVMLKGEICEVVAFPMTFADADGRQSRGEVTLKLLSKVERSHRGSRQQRRAELKRLQEDQAG